MVLFVEDFERTVRALKRALQGKWELESAASIADGKRAAARSAPSAALVDVVLPDGSGLDLVRWLRERWPALPIAVVTGMLDTTTVNEVSMLGDVALIAKPLDVVPVRSFLERAERSRRPRTSVDDLFEDARQGLQLSEREYEILRWVERGNEIQTFPTEAKISSGTVKEYTRRLLAKTGAGSVESLVIRIFRDAWTRTGS